MTRVAGEQPAAPRVLVTVGTDHHPFNRLMGWTNDWLGAHPEQTAGFFVQSGTVTVPPACPSSQFLDVETMDGLLDETDVLVCHGGPETIAAAWERGFLPVVVPRLPQFGEHVDDHQLRFALKLAELGRIWLAQSAAEFTACLSDATRDPARLRANVPAAHTDAAVARFGELVEELVRRPRRRLPLRRRASKSPVRPAAGTCFAATSLPPEPIPEPRPGPPAGQTRI